MILLMLRTNVLAENKIKYVYDNDMVPYSGVLMPEPYYREYVESSLLLLDCESVESSLVKEKTGFQRDISIFITGFVMAFVIAQKH